MADTEQTNLTALTVDLLSAYFANNTVDSAQLSGLIRTTHEALKGIDNPEPETPPEPEFKAAVTARKSLSSPDHIISLIDGKPYKTLKRHLSGHGLTPAEYRERYKLPVDYPMVAPAYSQQRRDVAAKLGLGRKPREAMPGHAEQSSTVEVTPAALAAPEGKASRAPTVRKATAKPKNATRPTEPATETSIPVPAAKKLAMRKPKAPVAASEPPKEPTPAAKRAPRKPKAMAEAATE